LSHYSITKAGVIALTRALAKEHGKDGFRINAILPGGIITPGTKAVAKEVLRFKFDLLKAGVEFAQRLPIRRPGQPDEVACIALVLASNLFKEAPFHFNHFCLDSKKNYVFLKLSYFEIISSGVKILAEEYLIGYIFPGYLFRGCKK
jgi:hypothetical protein